MSTANNAYCDASGIKPPRIEDTRSSPGQLVGPTRGRQPALSPDATLLAYTSNETGQMEVFLRPYPQDGPKVRVSSGGGLVPRWSPTGDRIYYRNGVVAADGLTPVMAVTLDRTNGLTLGPPRPVTIPDGIETYPGGFDIAPDGARLIVVMQNWAARR